MSIIIRPYTDSDLTDLAETHAAAKVAAEKGIILDTDLAMFTPAYYREKWAEWVKAENSQTLLAYDNTGKIQGFVSFGRVKSRPDFDKGVVPRFGGEIYALYVHPDAFRQGIGSALFRQACQSLSDIKINSMILWAMKKNKRACGFYESMGGERVGKRRIDIGERSWAEESCFAWRDVRKVF